MFNRVLVANRGAIARRVVRACHALGIETVAVYSDADKDAPHLAEATATQALPGVESRYTYLNQEALLGALRIHDCDALHPGYGFLAENADFAQKVLDTEVQFIGPRPQFLQNLGDKVAARALFSAHDFPSHAGSSELRDLDQARAQAQEVGYPILLKPSGGGGGIGMIRVENEGELERAFPQAQAMSQASFGTDALYIERFVNPARHIEFQMLADNHGNAMHVFERECSVQRRHQKVIEEAPAPGLDRAALERTAAQGVEVLQQLGYDNVGTIETLADRHGEFGFLEMNTRIQVEHAVTEEVTSLDLVATQIRLAAGESLPPQPNLSGHAIEVRIYAENPVTFAPSTGRLNTFRPPRMRHVRVETGYAEGAFVTPFYDPLIAKVIAHGATRHQAIGRALVGIKGFEVRGVETNIPLLVDVLQSDAFLAGILHTSFLEQFVGGRSSLSAHEVESEVDGSVWKIEVSVGDSVKAGDVLMILESMKMEIPVESPVDGTVEEIRVGLEEQIEEDQVLAVVAA